MNKSRSNCLICICICIAIGSLAAGCAAPGSEMGSADIEEAEEAELPQSGIPEAWQKRQNTCDTLSFYGVNPALNSGATPAHMLGKYKKLYYTSLPILKGWVPVYSAGQEQWHTGWVRQECLVNGWPYPQSGTVIY